MKRIKKSIMAASTLLVTALYLGFVNLVSAKGTVEDSLTNAGITTKGSTTGLFADLKNIVFLIMGIGGLWAVCFVIIGGMLLAGSGSNPQKRGAGIGAIGCACVGLYVIYKAYDIAGWATGLGG